MARTYDDRYRIGENFAVALNRKDNEAIRAAVAPDCQWVLPAKAGGSLLGTKIGPEAIVARLESLYAAQLNLFVEHVCVDADGNIALIFHNWGIREDKRIDEHLATTLTVDKHGKITRIVSYLSDIDNLFSYFT
jgi:ketosteroid isomerase-like protein